MDSNSEKHSPVDFMIPASEVLKLVATWRQQWPEPKRGVYSDAVNKCAETLEQFVADMREIAERTSQPPTRPELGKGFYTPDQFRTSRTSEVPEDCDAKCKEGHRCVHRKGHNAMHKCTLGAIWYSESAVSQPQDAPNIPIGEAMNAREALLEKYRIALAKIDAIRNSIVGFQNVGTSEHIYPLVAALNEAGFQGKSYEECKKEVDEILAKRAALKGTR